MHSILAIQQLCKQFGGVIANDHVDITLHPNQIHAIIGPNGAGKSTLLGQIAGEIIPDSGQIYFQTHQITQSSVELRSHLGLGRLFQTTALFPELSVLDNLRIPLMHIKRNNICKWFWQALKHDNAVRHQAMHLLEKLGLQDHHQKIAHTLSHGEQRQLEMAMTLATNPSCLLLDEPMAGMSSEESVRMIKLIKALKKDHAILLVEHDMNAVFELADICSVLVQGKLIASGTMNEIRQNKSVQAAYLGGDN